MDGAVPKNTKVADQYWIRIFNAFRREKNIDINLETSSAEELSEVLGKFYGGLCTKTGDYYQHSSYLCARAALQRHATTLKRPFSFREHAAFKQSDLLLDAVLKNVKAKGLSKPVKH